MVVRKMLEVEGKEIVVLRLYENKRRKMIRQMRLMVIVIVCKSLCDWIMIEELDG